MNNILKDVIFIIEYDVKNNFYMIITEFMDTYYKYIFFNDFFNKYSNVNIEILKKLFDDKHTLRYICHDYQYLNIEMMLSYNINAFMIQEEILFKFTKEDSKEFIDLYKNKKNNITKPISQKMEEDLDIIINNIKEKFKFFCV